MNSHVKIDKDNFEYRGIRIKRNYPSSNFVYQRDNYNLVSGSLKSLKAYIDTQMDGTTNDYRVSIERW